MKAFFGFTNKPLFFAWILVLLNLCLILKSGLYSDDLMNFMVRKSVEYMSVSQLLSLIDFNIMEGVHSGRFTPITEILKGLLIWLSSSILIYKLFIVGINILAVYTFTRFLKHLQMQELTPFALVLFCASAQFYVSYHDSFTSLHGMYPLLAVFIFSALNTFLTYLENGKLVTLFGALLLTMLAFLHCEIGFVIYPIVVIILIADSRPFTRKLLVFSPYIILLIAYVILFVIIRQRTTNFYSGVATNFDPSKMFSTFSYQVMAAIPMSRFANMAAIPIFLSEQFIRIYPLPLLCIIVFTGLMIKQKEVVAQMIDRRKLIVGLSIGLTLLLLPACMIMMTIKYQDELGYGKGYLPAYIQNFGFILLMLFLFNLVFTEFRKNRKMVSNIAFVVFFVFSVATLLLNDNLIDRMNQERSTPAVFYYKSLKNGILNECEEGSVIVLRTDYFYRSPYLYQSIIDNFYAKKFQVIAEGDFKRDDGRPYYILEHNNSGQFTVLYKAFLGEKKLVKQINYPTGRDFSYFDLISKPL